MKKLFLLLGFLTLGLLTATPSAQAQKKNVIKLNPLSAFVLHGNFSYERAITEKSSFQIGGLIGSIGIGTTNSGESLRYTGFGVTPEFRFYLAGPGNMRGFYVAPHLLLRNYNVSGTYVDNQGEFKSTANLLSFGGGATLGYQFIFSDVFSLEFLGGPQYRGLSFSATAEGRSDDQGVQEESINGLLGGGFGFRFGMTIGVAF